MAVDHYENFPVASLLLPRDLREAVRDIYRFARSADDIADEGDDPPPERLAKLQAYREALQYIERPASGAFPHPHLAPIFEPLAATVARHALPPSLFHDLISAFEQDVVKHRYANDAELFDYCRRSADPVGRLLLHLYERASPENLALSDAICTGLQLTNFWQDVAVDWHKGRVYLPQDKRDKHGVSEAWIGRCSEGGCLPASGTDPDGTRRWQALMHEQIEQARALLQSGRPLTRRLPWRAGLELRLVIEGGLIILERIQQLHYDVFERRPVLRPYDWLRMALRTLVK